MTPADRLRERMGALPVDEAPQPSPEAPEAVEEAPPEPLVALNSTLNVLCSQPGPEYAMLKHSRDPALRSLGATLLLQARRMRDTGVTFTWSDWQQLSPLDRSVIWEAYRGG